MGPRAAKAQQAVLTCEGRERRFLPTAEAGGFHAAIPMDEDHREVAGATCLVVEPPDPPVERWRPVAGYEGLYEVSDAGRVRSLTRTIRGRIEGTRRRWPGRVMTPEQTRYGTLAVQLCRDGVIHKRMVCELVLEAFALPVPAPRRRGRHRNGNRSDNRLANLEWGNRLVPPSVSLREVTRV